MNYNIQSDLSLIREYFGLSQAELAEILKVDRATLIRTENGDTYPRKEFMDKVYNFCFDKDLKLNFQKEMLYKENLNTNHILLAHGSKSGIEGSVSIERGRLNNDFGRGFYCGDSYDRAVSFVCRFPDASVYFIDFDPSDLKPIRFAVNTEWMLAIAYFRGRLDGHENSKLIKEIIGPILKADYIIAPIADNRMFQIIDTFIDGEITDEQCKHCLAATNLGMQYVFASDKALARINILERCFVSKSERDYYVAQHSELQKIGADKSKLARIQYRGLGKYIEEILA